MEKKKYFVVAKSRVALDANENVEERTDSFLYDVSGRDVINPDMFSQLNTVLKVQEGKAFEDAMIKSDSSYWHWTKWMVEITDKPVLLSSRLEKFLRKEGVYTRFRKNVRKALRIFPAELDQIYKGFPWSTSSEGHDYWQHLQNKYRSYYREMEKEREKYPDEWEETSIS